MRHLYLLIVLLFAALSPAHAVTPDEVLKDPALEERAREISKGLRCLVCQNQSIDDSDATLAKDLRVLVRDRLTSGDTDEEVISYVVSRYGDFVLLKPPFNAETLLLWLGPFLLALVGLWAIIVFYRRAKTSQAASPATQPLSEDEKRRLDALLAENQK